MYRNLEAEIARKNISKKVIAEELGIRYNTLTAKLRGDNKFTLDEALKIKQMLGAAIEVEQLFETSDKSA